MSSETTQPAASSGQAKPERPWRVRFRRWWRHRLTELTLSALVVLFVFAYFANTMLVTIRAGELGVKYKRFAGGTITDYVYPEGFHFVLPWDQLFVYDVRLQEVHRELQLLTEDGLPISVQGIVRYRPSRRLLAMLHKHVGPEYVQRIVIPEVDAALRTHVGRHTAEEVYKASGSLLHEVLDEIRIEATERYVILDDLLLQRIELPEPIAKAIETKVAYYHQMEAYEFRLELEEREVERKKVEARGYQMYNDIIRDSLDPQLLKWRAIAATEGLAKSANSKVIMIGNGDQGLPVILGAGQ